LKRFLSKLLLLTLFGLLIPSCQSINRSRAKTGITSSTVIFSFDDGPNAQDDTTGRLLDVLKKYEIKAFFSLLGENAEAYPDLVRRIHDEGHYIVNHGYSEKWAYRMGNDEFHNNLLMGEAAISKALGSEFHKKLYRPHGGFYSERQKTICLEQGYTIVTSNVRVYDTVIKGEQKGKAVKQILKKIEKQNGGIILLHDGRDSHLQMERELKKKPHGVFNRSWLPEAVEETIISLLNMGYNLKDYTLIEYS
jgi:peptidoglycan/xylan/chitin deacetylase (PgdA/CDA1 family)